jgi:hypothetical protein
MINLLPPAGLPVSPEAPEARARREQLPDFAAWLQEDRQPPIRDAGAPPLPAPGRDCEPSQKSAGEPKGEHAGGDERPAMATLVQEHGGAGRPGHAELIDHPWHLLANIGLSYAHLQSDPIGLANAAPADTVHCAASTETPLASSHPRGVFLSLSAPHVQHSPAVPTHPHGPGPVLEPEGNPENRLERLREWLATHSDWQERLLRWFGDDVEIVAWVRDFQLGGSELGELVHQIREHAHQHGRPLHRIFHNGREVWRAHPFTDSGSDT